MGQVPRTLLKVLVDQRRWRYADFAAKFATAAEHIIAMGAKNPTVGESQFRRWTAGKLKSLPGPDTRRVLEEMFGVEAALLFQLPPSSPQLGPTFNLEDEIDMTARDAHDNASAAASESLSNTTVDQLRDDVTALARRYNALPSLDVFRAARLIRDQAEVHRTRTQVPAQQQDLLVLAGQACALLAVAAFDLGSMDSAARLARSASLYGETARFEPLQGFSAGALAYIAYFRGQPTQGARLAVEARQLGGLGDTAHRRLAAIEARAHGHRGHVEAAQNALAASRAEEQGVTDEMHDEIGGEFGFSEERLAMSNSSTWLLIGDGEQAEAEASHALAVVQAKPAEVRSVRVVGGAAADLALARLLRGDLEAAEEALEVVWQTPQDQRATGLLHRTLRVRRTLSAVRFRSIPLAGELAERLEDFSVLSAQHQLGTGGMVAALEP